MIFHRTYIIKFMNEADHSFAAIRFKLILKWNSLIVQRFKQSVDLFELRESIFGDVLPNVVPEVGSEPQLVLKLNMQGLVVIVQPFTLQRLFTILDITVFAESSLYSVIWFDHDLPYVLLFEFPLMVLSDNLNFIRHLVRANLLIFK